MFLPFMLDQPAAGHEVEHVVNSVGCHRRGSRARHGWSSAVGFRPQAVEDETRVVAHRALAGLVVGMTGTVVGRPGQCQQVIVKIAYSCLGVVAVMVMLGMSGGG